MSFSRNCQNDECKNVFHVDNLKSKRIYCSRACTVAGKAKREQKLEQARQQALADFDPATFKFNFPTGQ